MARYTGPRVRFSRRFGVPIFGPSKYLERRNYGPGVHGPKSRRKHTDYGLGLIEKQNGHYRRYDWGDGIKAGAGLALRLRGKTDLFALAQRCGITPTNVDDHFQRAEPIKPLVLTIRVFFRCAPVMPTRCEESWWSAPMEPSLKTCSRFLA